MSAQILVVDDEPDVADLFRQQFRRELRTGRLKMDFAVSVAEALGLVAVAEEGSLIFIFSDINMPGETGFQLLPKVRALKPNVPIVLITAYGDAETRRKASEGGALDLVTKPIDFGALKQRVDQRLAELGQVS